MFGTSTGLRAGESTKHQPTAEGFWDDGWWVDTTPDPWQRSAERCDAIPSDLDGWEPGVLLAALVSRVDRAKLSGHDLVTLVRAEARLISYFQAGMYTSMSEVDSILADQESASAEVGAALNLTRAAADTEHALALGLNRFPRVLDSLRAGEIDLRRARVIVDGLVVMTTESAATALDRVLPVASALTTGQLRARIQRIGMEANPGHAKAQLQAGLAERRVVVEANPDGTANLLAMSLAPESVMAMRRRLNRLARHARAPGDERTHDQLRADTFVDLLMGRRFDGSPAATVDIVVPLETLTGASEAPGHIPGWGPVNADIARKVVDDQMDCQWSYIVTDQGQPVATGTISRRPTRSMVRRLRALHPTCVYPGCRMPAADSDIDHREPWSEGGPTSLDNNAPLCRHHHQLKDKGWSYRVTSGVVVWTSPLAHTYTTIGRSP